MPVVSRVANRVFVGAPLCMFIIPPSDHRFIFFFSPQGRDPEYLRNNVKYAVDSIQGGRTLAWFPTFLKP